MSQSRLAGRQNPYGLLLFESLVHILAIGFLFFHLPHSLTQRSHYLVLSMLGVAVLLRIVTALAASKDSSITGNFGQSNTLAQAGASSLLGLSWGAMVPLLSYWEVSTPGLQAAIRSPVRAQASPCSPVPRSIASCCWPISCRASPCP